MLFVTFWRTGFFFYGFKHTVFLFCALLFLIGSQLVFVSVFSYTHYYNVSFVWINFEFIFFTFEF